MPGTYKYSDRKSARTYSTWPQIFPIAVDVIERASCVRKLSALVMLSKTSQDSWRRCAGSAHFGGWTAERILALIDFEELHLGTSELRKAWNGERRQHEEGDPEAEADRLLPKVLTFASDVTRYRPKGLDRRERIALLAVLPDILDELHAFQRDLKTRQRKGK